MNSHQLARHLASSMAPLLESLKDLMKDQNFDSSRGLLMAHELAAWMVQLTVMNLETWKDLMLMAPLQACLSGSFGKIWWGQIDRMHVGE